MVIWFHESGHAMDSVGFGTNKYSSSSWLLDDMKDDFRQVVYLLVKEGTGTPLNQKRSREQTDYITNCLLDWNRGDGWWYEGPFNRSLTEEQQNGVIELIHQCFA